jgi:hypothetical protein
MSKPTAITSIIFFSILLCVSIFSTHSISESCSDISIILFALLMGKKGVEKYSFRIESVELSVPARLFQTIVK